MTAVTNTRSSLAYRLELGNGAVTPAVAVIVVFTKELCDEDALVMATETPTAPAVTAAEETDVAAEAGEGVVTDAAAAVLDEGDVAILWPGPPASWS